MTHGQKDYRPSERVFRRTCQTYDGAG